MRALSIRQPFAELILRGIKTAEIRSTATTILGERFYIYACKAKAKRLAIWSQDLQIATPPSWMLELAEQLKLIEPELLRGTDLPRGVIVGSAVIDQVIPPNPADGKAGRFRWQLADVRRIDNPFKPKGHPQPVWFEPF
jgi:ASCH domain